MNHVETVKTLYAAFQRGDLQTILDQVTDDVDWNNERVASKDVPWNANYSGKAKLPGFFQALAKELDFKVFEPRTFLPSGEHVAVLLRIESVLKKNGQPLENDCVHVWAFDARGKVKSYRHYNDTAAEMLAWQAPATAGARG